MKTTTEEQHRRYDWSIMPDQICVEPEYFFIPLEGGRVATMLRGGMADISTRELGGKITDVQPFAAPAGRCSRPVNHPLSLRSIPFFV